MRYTFAFGLFLAAFTLNGYTMPVENKQGLGDVDPILLKTRTLDSNQDKDNLDNDPIFL